MKNWSIQRRVLFIALLPAALIALVLSAYHAETRMHQVETTTLDYSHSLARHLAPLSEFGVLSGNRRMLQSLVESTLRENPTIIRVAIHDRDGHTLAQAGSRPGRPATAGDDDSGQELIAIAQPIRRTLMEGTDTIGPSDAPTLAEGEAIGQVRLWISLAPVRREQSAVLYESLAITFLSLLLTAMLAVRIGRGVTRPVQRLTRTVERIRGGDLGARPPMESGGELGSLEQGIAEMAREIQRTQASLQDRVDSATRELQHTLSQLEERNAALEEARLDAEAASEFKSRFLANVSHEIRTPMNSVLGFAELLEQADLDPIHADYLATIHNSAQGLLTLLNGILDLSKVESGRMELEYAETDVNDLMLEIFQLLAPQSFQKGVEFVVTPMDPSLARVRADAVRLKQVLINLGSNAVKFTRSGYVHMSAQGTTRPDGDISITFRVEDTGIGIPHAAQARLFQAFAQGDQVHRSGERTTSPGTGLGLHIASEIVFLMDGFIEFESEPDAGSVFWFTLELETGQRVESTLPADLPARRVLYIDPTPGTADLYRPLLEYGGLAVDVNTEPRRGRHDAIVVHVPAERVTECDIPSVPSTLAGADLPVLAFCYASAPDARPAVSAAGYTAILPKTPDFATLRRVFERTLGAALGVPVDPARELPAPSGPRVRGLRVLVVDDHPINLKLMQSYLADTGNAVVGVGSSEDALYECDRQTYDAILMDIHLPGRDGVETARIIRDSAGLNADTPIIAITADAFVDQSRRALEAGFNDALVKPVSRDTLMTKLAEWCITGDAAPADPSGTSPAGPDSVAAETPVIDPDAAIRHAGGRRDLATELFGILCRTLPESRERLERARATADTVQAHAAAHRLRGAVAYCGVPRLEAALAALETIARTDEASALEPAIRRAFVEIDAVLAHEGWQPPG